MRNATVLHSNELKTMLIKGSEQRRLHLKKKKARVRGRACTTGSKPPHAITDAGKVQRALGLRVRKASSLQTADTFTYDNPLWQR